MSKICLFSNGFRRPVNLTDEVAEFNNQPPGLEIPDDGQIILIELDFLRNTVGDPEEFRNWVNKSGGPVLVFGFPVLRPSEIPANWHYREEAGISDGLIQAIIANSKNGEADGQLRDLVDYGVEWLEQLREKFAINGRLTSLDERLVKLGTIVSRVDTDESGNISDQLQECLDTLGTGLNQTATAPAGTAAAEVTSWIPDTLPAEIDACPWAVLAVIVVVSAEAAFRIERGTEIVQFIAEEVAFPKTLLQQHRLSSKRLLDILTRLVTSYGRNGALDISNGQLTLAFQS